MKKQESMVHSQDKKKQQTDIVSKEAQTLNLLDKDFKSNILNMLQSQRKPWSKK